MKRKIKIKDTLKTIIQTQNVDVKIAMMPL